VKEVARGMQELLSCVFLISQQSYPSNPQEIIKKRGDSCSSKMSTAPGKSAISCGSGGFLPQEVLYRKIQSLQLSAHGRFPYSELPQPPSLSHPQNPSCAPPKPILRIWGKGGKAKCGWWAFLIMGIGGWRENAKSLCGVFLVL
jgi:hypothetical protein